MRRYLLTLLIAFCCLTCRAEDTRGWEHVDGAWVNTWSATRFPESLDDLLKTTIRQYGDSGLDSSIGYRSAQSGMALTAYVYPQRSDKLLEDFGEEVGVVLNHYKQARLIVAGEANIDCSFKDSDSPVLAATMQFDYEGRPMDSVLVLTRFDSRYFKLRISAPRTKDGAQRLLQVADRFISLVTRQQTS